LEAETTIKEFNRQIFESIVDYVIVGGYNEEGNADPSMITFVYRTGFKDRKDANHFKLERLNASKKKTGFDSHTNSKAFFEKSPLPVYVVSNIDISDILQAVAYHGLNPAGVFTSEDAKSYKPRKELFELALKSTGLAPDEVMHIGDSVGSDVQGAAKVGIRALWLNRFGKSVPEGVENITRLSEAFDRIG
jgi:HAD superfamily hydrolase (TIGR01493 family)